MYRTVAELFDTFMREPNMLPPDYQQPRSDAPQAVNTQARKVSDYIAGMTDRYAIREYKRLFMIDEM